MANTNPNTFQFGDLSKYSSDLDYVEQVKDTGVTMRCPVRLGLKRDGSDLWTLPLEPLVSVSGGKTIVRRNVAKGKGFGSVKEQWSQDDYEISIEGLLQSSELDSYPEAYLSKLKTFLTQGQSLVIHCKILDLLGVDLLCIEKWSFPSTAGIENQQYTISGYSDQDFDLIATK